MATQKKNTVDYFPHMIGDGKKMDFIEKRYGNDGYATWFKLLEALARTDNHYLNLNDEIEISFLASRCNVDEEALISIINDLVKIKVFDAELWKHRVIWSQIFVDSIQDAYKRRANKCMQHADIIKELITQGFNITPIMHATCIHDVDKTPEIVDKNPQSKLNYSKEDKSRVDESMEEEGVSIHPSIQEIDLDKILPDAVISVETVIKLLKSERWGAWRDNFGMKKSVLPDKMFVLLDLFEEHLKDQNQFTKSTRDAQLHFFSWFDRVYLKNIQKEAEVSKNGGDKPTHEGKDKEQIGNWVWLNGKWIDKTTIKKHQLEKYGII